MSIHDVLLAVANQPGATRELEQLLERIQTGTLSDEEKAAILRGTFPSGERFSEAQRSQILAAILLVLDAAELLRVPADGGPITTRVLREVEWLRRRNLLLERKTAIDSCTGLANGEYFRQKLSELYLHCLQHGGSISVFFLDLDRFKVVNDTLGHEAGDELLVAVARRLESSIKVRERDVIGRVLSTTMGGGDEFGIVVGGLRKRDVEPLARRIQAAICQPYAIHGTHVEIGASMGISYRRIGKLHANLSEVSADTLAELWDEGAETRSQTSVWGQSIVRWCRDMLKQADEAMYEIKRSGGGIRMYDQEPSPPRRRSHAAPVSRSS
jgi:diguanylate cyclase (GGDEF)-like protein